MRLTLVPGVSAFRHGSATRGVVPRDCYFYRNYDVGPMRPGFGPDFIVTTHQLFALSNEMAP